MMKNSIMRNLNKPAFNAKDFVDGMVLFKKDTANDFLYFVQNKIKNNHYDFSVIVESITGAGITNEAVSDSLISEDGFVFTKNGKLVTTVTHSELLQILESGRRDKGILPQPVIRKAFEEYRPIYKDRFNKFLKGKL